MILINNKYFFYFFYNTLSILFLFNFFNFYFFKKNNGKLKFYLLKKKLHELDKKKSFLENINKEIKIDLKKWKNQFSKKEAFVRENLDLIKNGELKITLKQNN